jgi:hypothetical protein
MDGFINLCGEEFSLPIYRVFSKHRFDELIANRRNTLVRPILWDDPFENALLRAKGELEDGTRASVAFKLALQAS